MSKQWWTINALNDDYLETEFFIRAKEVGQVSEEGIVVDGNDLYYPNYTIRKISPATYDIMLFSHVLETYFRFEFNDSNTWKLFEEFFPGTICNNTVNTPEVVDKNVLRFSYNGKLYEYAPLADQILKVNLIG